MKVVYDLTSLRQTIASWKLEGASIALVPTMGNLHDGHLSLVKKAKQLCYRVVVSIYVNPLQFDRKEDLTAYPRTFEEDRLKLKRFGIDLLFCPEDRSVYPRALDDMTRVEVASIPTMLEGEFRPGHFTGVATVVTKLLNIVQPDVAVFGEKDFQQLLLIKRMVEDLDLPVQIESVPIVREADGLAMSSRNTYLTPWERRQAPHLYAALCKLADEIQSGQASFRQLEQTAIRRVEDNGLKIEYISVRNRENLTEARTADNHLVILAAAWIGKARLIDALPLDV